MPKFRIVVTYTMYGYYEDVEAENMTEAMELVKNSTPPYNSLPLDCFYLDDSFQVVEEDSEKTHD